MAEERVQEAIWQARTSVLDVKSKNWIQIPALACKSPVTLNMLNCLFELWFIL